MNDSKTLKNIENKLSALLTLTTLSVFGGVKGIKPEVLLSNAGLENSEIAKILGKKLPAVQKVLQRSKK